MPRKENETAFLESVLKMPEIQECYRVSGEFPCLLKIWARDLPHLEHLLDQETKARAGVIRTKMSIVLSSPKDQVTGLAAR